MPSRESRTHVLKFLARTLPVEGPPIPITIDMVKKAISQMKGGKAPGPPSIMVEISKLTEQVMKVLEWIVDGLIRQVVSVNDSQFGFVAGRSTTGAIFVRQLQKSI